MLSRLNVALALLLATVTVQTAVAFEQAATSSLLVTAVVVPACRISVPLFANGRPDAGTIQVRCGRRPKGADSTHDVPKADATAGFARVVVEPDLSWKHVVTGIDQPAARRRLVIDVEF